MQTSQVASLPGPGARWTPRRKAQVVQAVMDALLSETEAKRRYRLSPEEWESWVRAVDARYLSSLRVSSDHLRRRRLLESA
jgi:hypothetical protein